MGVGYIDFMDCFALMRMTNYRFQMPFTVPVVRCPKCNQPVYHAEEVLAIGQKWHRTCFRCGRISMIVS